MSNTDIHNPHDKLFRAAMQHPAVAREFLIAHCPPHILKHIDLDTVKVCPNSFIDNVLKLSQSDVLLEAKLIDPEGHIYILIEQQSQPDPPMPFRIWHYEQAINNAHLRKSKKGLESPLPIILSMVFYTGKQTYTAPRAVWQMGGEYSEMMRTIHQEPHELIEAKNLSVTSLINSLYSGTMEFVMRPQFRENVREELPQIAENLNQLVLEGQTDYVLQLLTYIAAVEQEKRTAKEILELIVDKMLLRTGDKIVDFAQMLRDEGRQEGRQEGRHEAILKTARRLLAVGSDPAFVALATELPLSDVKKLKSTLVLESE